MAKLWDLHSFKVTGNDYGPSTWPPPKPCWISELPGRGRCYYKLAAYLPAGSNLLSYWPDATEDKVETNVKIEFSWKRECPDWWDQENEEVRNG